MKLEISPYGYNSLGNIATYLRRQFTAVSAGWNVEHAPDGTHKFPSGRWTPVLGGQSGTTGQAYALQYGWYVKSGQMVWVSFRFQLTAKGTITGNVEIKGLPFRSSAKIGPYGTGEIIWNFLSTAFISIKPNISTDYDRLLLYGLTAAAPNDYVNVTTADLTNTTYMVGSITYVTDD